VRSKLAFDNWRGLFGIELSPVSHRERLISALGAAIGIALVYGITRAVLGPGHALILAAPIGATAVLLFAIPHGAMSQPWPVVGGYAISTTIMA
jgi:CBS-domain-containing membrane protein